MPDSTSARCGGCRSRAGPWSRFCGCVGARPPLRPCHPQAQVQGSRTSRPVRAPVRCPMVTALRIRSGSMGRRPQPPVSARPCVRAGENNQFPQAPSQAPRWLSPRPISVDTPGSWVCHPACAPTLEAVPRYRPRLLESIVKFPEHLRFFAQLRTCGFEKQRRRRALTRVVPGCDDAQALSNQIRCGKAIRPGQFQSGYVFRIEPDGCRSELSHKLTIRRHGTGVVQPAIS